LIPFKISLYKNEFFKLTLISFLNGSDIILLFEQALQSSIQSDRPFLIVLIGNYLISIIFILVYLFQVNILCKVFICLSTFQFSFMNNIKYRRRYVTKKLDQIIDIIFGTPIWALLITFMIHDLPFFILRVLILIYYPFKSNSFLSICYFYTFKNLFLSLHELSMIFYYLFKSLFRKRLETDV
jgi:hypothetical protein